MMRGRNLLMRLALLAILLSAAQIQPAGAQSKKSGYLVGPDRCGQGPMAFPKVRIGTSPGYCAGLVASKDDGLIFPRSIVQVPDSRLFVIADMGGWGPARGRFLLLDPEAPDGKRLKVLMTNIDFPHGLAVGIDRRVYASTDQKIFRFDPLAGKPETTMEVILQGLPGRRVTLSDGTTIAENAHPLKQFVFDRTGRIYVNIGAPTDACTTTAVESKPCAAGEGPAPMASIWAFTPPSGGTFPALRPGDANPPREIYSRGLRNSMAIAVHPQFPTEGFAFLQAENARDLPEPSKPNEELNALQKGKHYGWPYCYDLTTSSPEFETFLQGKTEYQELCTSSALYGQPHSLQPPHAAPLSMLYYEGAKFPQLRGKLIVGLHGYRPTGSRIIFYDVDEKGFPTISPAPVRYGVSCAAEPTEIFRTEAEAQVSAAGFSELVVEWHKVVGVRPQGAPVGMTVAADGAIWIVEDKNQSILRLDADPAATAVEKLPCSVRTEQQIKELVDFVSKDTEKSRRLSLVRTQLIERRCLGCHSDFDLKTVSDAAQRNKTLLSFLLRQDGWLYPGDPAASRLHRRVWAKGAEKPMPANAKELIDNNRDYRQLLRTLDLFMETIVPGERRRVRTGSIGANLRNRAGGLCGLVPNETIVIVVDRRPPEKPGFGRIFRPADQYLNGDCTDDQGYYVSQQLLGAP